MADSNISENNHIFKRENERFVQKKTYWQVSLHFFFSGYTVIRDLF